MCFCCCGCCCNSQSSKCIETSILLLSIINFISPLFLLIFVKLSHINLTTKILLIITIVFTLLNLISIIIIYICRKKSLINTTKNSFSLCLSRIGLILCILSFILSIIIEAFIKINLTELDYPCSDFVYGISNITKNENGEIIWFRNLASEDFSQEEKEFCETVHNKKYYAKICSTIEYIITYISTSFIEIFTIILTFLWHNDSRRIMARVDGALGNRKFFAGRGSLNAANIYRNQIIQNEEINKQRAEIEHKRRSVVSNLHLAKKKKNAIGYIRNKNFNSVDEEAGSSSSKKMYIHKRNRNMINNDNSSEKSIKYFSSTKLRKVKKKKIKKPCVKKSSDNVVIKNLRKSAKYENHNKNENNENNSINKNENEFKKEDNINIINSPRKRKIFENDDITGGSYENNKNKNKKEENIIKLNVIEN